VTSAFGGQRSDPAELRVLFDPLETYSGPECFQQPAFVNLSETTSSSISRNRMSTLHIGHGFASSTTGHAIVPKRDRP
jgi:hypothetical protein